MTLQITVWDVQHGNAAHIQTPNNRHILVDLGDNGDEFSSLQHLYATGVREVDTVVITHGHRDHLDDICNFPLLRPKVLITPRTPTDADVRKGNRASDSGVVDQYLAIRRDYSSPVPAADDFGVPANWGGANLDFFAPSNCDVSNLNNRSIVVVVSYAGLKMVIPGDNEAPSWRELLKGPAFVSAIKGTDVLLAAHHGRDAGYCADMFAAMGQPRLVVISDGRFGDTSATDRYGKQARGWEVYDASGASDKRKCVSTRCDGHVTIKMGWQNPALPRHGNFLNVTTNKSNPSPLYARILAKAALALSGY